jgi:chromosome segregation ATPase
MNKRQDLEKLESEINDVSARIEAVKHHIRKIESEIALLKNLEHQFRQNLSILKSDGTIAVASEYKKSRDDLAVVLNRTHALQIDVNNHGVMLERMEKYLLDAKEKYVILFKNQGATVITGKFGNDRQE